MRIPVHIAIWATVLALFSPSRFLTFQSRITVPLGVPAASDTNTVNVVARAFWTSVVVVAGAAVLGIVFGLGLAVAFGSPSSKAIAALQIFGASILLLATIYVRGASIGTFKRQTLIERIDRWIYIAGYCLGTAAMVTSLAWT